MGLERLEYDLRLVDKNLETKRQLSVSGTYQVLAAGTANEATIYAESEDSSAADNPGSISSGQIRFFVDRTVTTVDIVIYTADGDAEFLKGIAPTSNHRVEIDQYRKEQLLHLPILFNDNSETDTGFTLPASTFIDDIDLIVDTVDATETIDVGLDGTTSNDPNGLIAAASIATAGYVELAGAINNGSNIDFTDAVVYGALLASFINGSDAVATNGGSVRTKHYVGSAETDANITYTCSAGSDTFTGWLILHLRKGPE